MDLVLPVKRKWFEQIKSGQKGCEYRICSPYWQRRLVGKRFDRVIITLGYPKKSDTSRRLVFPWSGCDITQIIHQEFDYTPTAVFAIPLIKEVP